jgi:hypothetical protein
MKASELLLACLAHVLGLAAALIVLAKLQVGDPDIAWVVAAILGSYAGAYPYHKRHPEKATPGAMAMLGAVLASMSVIEGALVLAIWNYRPFPQIVIPIAAVGTFFFPFVFFRSVRKAFERSRTK